MKKQFLSLMMGSVLAFSSSLAFASDYVCNASSCPYTFFNSNGGASSGSFAQGTVVSTNVGFVINTKSNWSLIQGTGFVAAKTAVKQQNSN